MNRAADETEEPPCRSLSKYLHWCVPCVFPHLICRAYTLLLSSSSSPLPLLLSLLLLLLLRCYCCLRFVVCWFCARSVHKGQAARGWWLKSWSIIQLIFPCLFLRAVSLSLVIIKFIFTIVFVNVFIFTFFRCRWLVECFSVVHWNWMAVNRSEQSNLEGTRKKGQSI